jgi:cell division protein FtsB
MAPLYQTSLWTLDIKYKLDKLNPTMEIINFICEDMKTGKEYDQSYKLSELFEKHKILSVYPNMFQSIVKKKMPSVEFKNGCAIVAWELEIPFEEIERIELKIEERNKEGLSEEFVELQQSNKLLKLKNKELEDKVKKLEDDVGMVKEILLKCPNIPISTIVAHPELVKQFIDYGMNITTHPKIHNAVSVAFMTLCGADLNKFETNEYKFIKEIIKNGYSVTSLNTKSEELGCNWKYAPTMVSILVQYIFNGITMSDNGFLVFKKAIELVLSTANLNIKYGKGGTILDLFKKQQNELIQHYSCINISFGDQTEHVNLIRSHRDKIVEYLESVGAK